MAKEKIDLREELQEYRCAFNLIQKIPCTPAENLRYSKLVKEGAVLPEGVHAVEYDDGEESKTEFYTIFEPDLTEAEIKEYLHFKQLRYLKTIRNCAVFFTVLTIVGMIGMLLLMLNVI